MELSWESPVAPGKATEPKVRLGLKPVTLSPAIVVEPVRLTGPDTVKDEIVDVPAVKVPLTLALPAIEVLPETVSAP